MASLMWRSMASHWTFSGVCRRERNQVSKREKGFGDQGKLGKREGIVGAFLLLLFTYIVDGVDVGAGLVAHVLEEESGGEAVGVGGGVVGAAVAALVPVGGLAGVLLDDNGEVVVEAGVGVVLDDAGGARGLVAGHVLVEVGDDVLALGGVGLEDGGGADEADLLTGVEVELHRVLGGEAGLGEDAEGLEDDDGARGVVVGAGGGVGGLAGGGVEVGADDDEVLVLAGDAGDDGGLVEASVLELLDGDGGVGGANLGDLLEEPGGGLGAGLGLAVTALV